MQSTIDKELFFQSLELELKILELFTCSLYFFDNLKQDLNYVSSRVFFLFYYRDYCVSVQKE